MQKSFKMDTPSPKHQAEDIGILNNAFAPDLSDSSNNIIEVNLDMQTDHVRNKPAANGNLSKGQGALMKTTPPAISVKGAYKSYKSKKGNTNVLDGLDMTIEEGSIYSLLGSSGCGKTTLLQCCVGVKNLDQGQIRIFGHKPNTRQAGVPGRNVGYMPQEIALYLDLTIQEVLLYFGRMFGMTRKAVDESSKFLISFLALPPPYRKIGTLSGGQMRRVSFAVALVHSPRLLILDEPTVGVDPLLRQSIWNHLVKLVSSGDTTVLITTHYVSEATQSNRIGLMRNGRLLAEDSPTNLLKTYNTNLLEDIVLKLCLQDTHNSTSANTSNSSSVEDVPSAVIISQDANILENRHDGKSTLFKKKKKNEFSLTSDENENAMNRYLPSTLTYGDVASVELKGVCQMNDNQEGVTNLEQSNEIRRSVDFNVKESVFVIPKNPEFEEFHRLHSSIRRQSSVMQLNDQYFSTMCQESFSRIKAIVLKNTITMFRNFPFLLFMVFMPAIQVITMCMTVGQDPKGLSFGLVNFDTENSKNCTIIPGCLTYENSTGRLSCRFLDILEKKGTLQLTIHDNEEDAAAQVEIAKSWGYLLFHQNYTESMKDRAIFGSHSELETIYGSRMKFRLDQSNLQVLRETTKVFLETFNEFMHDLSTECQVDPVLTEPPIFFAQPIFGSSSVSFTDFLAPSILLAILFFFPLAGSGIAFITEKKSGTLSRSLVAGVTTFEIMSAYLIVQLVLLLIQIAISFFILEWAFNIPILGPLHCAYLICLLVGVSGMSLGFLMAVYLQDEFQAVLAALGFFLPNILLSGLLWPLEGMPIALQVISRLLPCTYAGEALRSVLSRGVSYTHPSVWPGFVSVSIWILLFWTINILYQKYKSKT